MLQTILAIIATYYLLIIAYYVLSVIGKWMVFNKMGESGWKSLIPFYSDYIIYKDCWNTTPFFVVLACSLILLAFDPEDASSSVQMLINLAAMVVSVISFLANIKMSRSFGHGYLFAFGLFLLEPIFTIILGFGSSRYIGNTTV